jgi:peroxiredoxin
MLRGSMPSSRQDPNQLPKDLPAPVDDRGARHLPGLEVPPIVLLATDGCEVRLDRAGSARRTVVYAYPRTGRPGELPPSADWDLIPGARGCTPQACDFRDHHAELLALGANVYGISTQSSDFQREVVERLHLPFVLLSDAELKFASALALPTFQAAGETLLRRLTLIVGDAHIEHVFYPVFPPDRHASEVLAWLRENR